MSGANKTTNGLLRHAREARGWSQSYVAKHVNTNPFTVSRWEKGVTFPNSKHRLELGKLFGMSMAELGLVPPSKELRNVMASTNTVTVSPITLYDPAIPHLLHPLIGRENVFTSLKILLTQQKQTKTFALQGLFGVGKTAIAVALSRDEEVRAHFSGGILWAHVGSQPDIFGLLSRWAKLLGLGNTQRKTLTSVEELIQTLRSTIGMRSLLIIIDDVWNVDVAFALQVGGPHCTYLMTTRQAHIALQCAGAATTIIHELSTDEGVSLLTQLAPVCKSIPHDVRVLVQAVGGLPLALTLMGRYIQAETHQKHTRRLTHAIEQLRSPETRLHLSQPLDPTEGIASIAESTTYSLQTVIAPSEHYLSQEARMALRALASFPPKPGIFQEEAALAIAQIAPHVLDELTDAGLVESRGQGNYTIHPVIADYARTALKSRA